MIKVRSYTTAQDMPVKVVDYDDNGQGTDISEHYSNYAFTHKIPLVTATLDVYRTPEGALVYDGLPNGKELSVIADYIDLVGLACNDATLPAGSPCSLK